MPRDNETTTKFKVDISELKSAMQQAKQATALANSEFRLATAGLDDWSKSSDGVSAKLKQLKSNLSSQKSVLTEYEKILAQVKAKYGENSDEAQKWQTKVNNQKATLAQTESEIKKLKHGVDDLTESTKESGEGFTVFKGVLANLVTDGIHLLIDGAKKATSALIDMGKQSLSAYSDYEQLTGGVETLFGDSADEIKKYANNAFKTAGMSANEYMETVTSFSASLIQSLDGDTAKSAKIADMAITDMSDNANKMGTSIEAIQNAYGGFAKGNFTMLDNLKLGYGGTQEEMKRLLTDAQKISGIKYNISSFADISEAIHVIQTDLKISGLSYEEAMAKVATGEMTLEEATEAMGTTAKEASTTIEGSTKAMKASWQNLLVGMANENADFEGLVDSFVGSVMTMLSNVMPRVTQIVSGMGKLVSSLAPIMASELPKLIDSILPTLLTSLGALGDAILQAIIGSAPTILKSVLDLVKSITDALPATLRKITDAIAKLLPEIITSIGEALPEILENIIWAVDIIGTALVDMAPDILDAGLKLFTGLVEALPELIDDLLYALDEIVVEICYGLVDAIPTLMESALQFFHAIVDAIPQIITSLLEELPYLLDSIIEFLINGVPQLIEGAIQLFNALIDALPIVISALVEALPQIINAIVNVLVTSVDVLIEGAISLLMAIVDAIPKIIPPLIDALPTIINAIIGGLIEAIPQLIEGAITLLMAIVEALPTIIIALAEALPQIITTIIDTLIDNIPLIIDASVQVFMAILEAIPQIIVALAKALPDIVKAVIDGLSELPAKLGELGVNMVKGLWNGIKDMASWIGEKIKGFGEGIVNGLKDFFGIHSPSKLMEKEIGKFLPEGIAVGIDKNAKSVMSAMKDLTMNTLGATRDGLIETGVTGGISGGVVNNFYQTNNSPKALSRLEIYRQSKNLLGYAGGGM